MVPCSTGWARGKGALEACNIILYKLNVKCWERTNSKITTLCNEEKRLIKSLKKKKLNEK